MLLISIRLSEFSRLDKLGFINPYEIGDKKVYVVTAPYDRKKGLTTTGLSPKKSGVII